MGKLLKYELKNSITYFIYLILGGLVASALIILGFKSFTGDDLSPGMNNVRYTGLIFPITLIIAVILIVGISIAFLFFVVTNYKRDLYDEKSLLKFSLPINGSEFLNSKLINILIWTILMYILVTSGSFFLSRIFIPNIHESVVEGLNTAIALAGLNGSHFILLGVMYFCQTVFGFITLYFTITLAKAVFKNSKSGIVWFLLYMILNAVLSIISYFIEMMLPYRVEFFQRIELVERTADMVANMPSQQALLSFNLVTAILYLILAIVFYFTTIYMLDNKVDF